MAVKDPSDISAALDRAKLLIATRERSSKELYERLVASGFHEDVAEEVLARCRRASLVNDTRFASLYVESHIRKGWGRARIVRGLAQAGINPNVVSELDALASEEEEIARACDLLDVHHTSSRHPDQANYAYLVRRGFSSSVASKAVRQHGLNR
jgi:SOS response regulatory protein OraA/RecX